MDSASEAAFLAPSAVSGADLPLQTFIGAVGGAVGRSLLGVSAWQVLLTLLVLCVTYDQGELLASRAPPPN